jgi:stage III sporulation protein AD
VIVKILSIGVVTVVVSIIIKQYRPDIALLCSICGGLMMIMLVSDSLGEILDSMVSLSSNISVSADVVTPITKVIGIGYLTEFCADMADDAGNKSISSKILFGGKIAICVVALPIITNMLSAILSLL